MTDKPEAFDIDAAKHAIAKWVQNKSQMNDDTWCLLYCWDEAIAAFEAERAQREADALRCCTPCREAIRQSPLAQDEGEKG